jgi:hypothetical protein
MVFLNITEIQALKWKEIDPHFRDDKNTVTAAPSPAARFPASPQGWSDAIEYARTKQLREMEERLAAQRVEGEDET